MIGVRFHTVAAIVGGSIFAAACGKGAVSATAGGDTARSGTNADSGAKAKYVTITAEQAKRIRIADVVSTSFRPSIQTTGTVAFNGDRSTQVLAPLSGPITKILVQPGSVVKKGEALATVTSPDFATAISAYRKARR